MAGLTTADGCVFPELGLRSEAAIATSSSAMYRKAINIVQQELEATSLDHPALNITKLMEDLELDPVMETASVRLSPFWGLCVIMSPTTRLYLFRQLLMMATHGPQHQEHLHNTKIGCAQKGRRYGRGSSKSLSSAFYADGV